MIHIRMHRSDGKTGHYSQSVAAREGTLLERLHPQRVFSSGPIVIGVHNPFSVLNPDEVCWVELQTRLTTVSILPPGIDDLRLLESREAFERILADHWPVWRKAKKGNPGDMLEALVELSLRSGESVYLQVIGKITKISVIDAVFGMPAITARRPPDITAYINPKCIVRARIYHSKSRIDYPNGCWVAEADDI